MLNRRRILAGALALLCATPVAAQQISISGVYRAEGRNPDGSTYGGTAIVAEANGAVQISWTVGAQGYVGTGTRQGQVVTVNWGQPEPVVYVIMNNGQLHGTWANGTALERLIPQ